MSPPRCPSQAYPGRSPPTSQKTCSASARARNRSGQTKTAAPWRPHLVLFKPSAERGLGSVADPDPAIDIAIPVPIALANDTAGRLFCIDRPRRVIDRRRGGQARRQGGGGQRN